MNRAALERSALVLTPVVALATLALGLRIGGSSRIYGARVYAAPAGTGRAGVALQLVTLTEESGVAELAVEPHLTVVASARGQEARWEGHSSNDGIAEAWLDLPGLSPGATLQLRVTNRRGAVLASGGVTLPGPSGASWDDAPVRPMRKAGALALDVFVYGALIPGVAVPTFVRVHGRARAGGGGSEGIALKVDPEPGLSIAGPLDSTCAFVAFSDDAWCEIPATAEFLTASWTLTAHRPSLPTEQGTWYGALPVSPGGATTDLPPRIDPGAPHAVHFVVPPATRKLYVEVTDARGIDAAAALDVTPTSRGGAAELTLPSLAPGDYWLVSSPDPHDSESQDGSRLGRPFRVALPEESAPPTALRDLVTHPTPKISRSLALEGLNAPRRLAATARRRGLWLAFGALSIGAALETLLILQALGRGRKRLAALSAAAFDALGEPTAVAEDAEGSRALLTVAALLFITLLGFGLLAGLLAMSTTG